MVMLGLLAGLVRASSRSRGFPALGAQLLSSSLLEQRATVCSVCSALIAQAQQQHQHEKQHEQQHEQLQQQHQAWSENAAAAGHLLPSSHPHPQSHRHQRRLLLPVPPALRLHYFTTQVSPGSSGPSPMTQQALSESWGYRGVQGVNKWPKLFPDCNGTSQSPVNIDKSKTKLNKSLTAFTFRNFDTVNGIALNLQNNGHSAQVTYTKGDLVVSAGGLCNDYKVAQFHFHWGSNDSLGSEHTIDGKRFPMEMHIVTYNSAYDNFTEAVKQTDGLAVLGIFFEADPNGRDNKNYTELVNNLSSIIYPESSVSLPAMMLESLLPAKRNQFYRYPGSLTTPPCSEVVTWTLFNDPVHISSKQLEAFRALVSSDKNQSGVKKKMVNNFRPVQPLNGRQIMSSF